MRGASRRFVAEAAAAAALAVGGTLMVIAGLGPAPPEPAAGLPGLPLPPLTARTVPPSVAKPHAATAALPPSAPISLEIPAIGVSTSLIELGLQPDGTVRVPPLGRDSPAGWYRDGTTPGATGPAVVLGHVDSAHDGPAVFYRLRELTRGAAVRIHRSDGITAVFTVTRINRYRKDNFPTSAVYGPVDRPVLRLVTCGGSFDRIRRSYRENLVVFADLTSSTPARRPDNRASLTGPLRKDQSETR